MSVAALLHVAATIAAFIIGRYGLMPNLFDADGIAGSFAPDGRMYMTEARLLVEELAAGRLSAWLDAPFPLHAKLYSLCFAALGWCFGFTILSAEPLNLAVYLAILILVYKLGTEAFDARAGLFAASVVALWPSMLLHTTQLLKDPLFIVALLALALACARLLSGELSRAGGLRIALAGGVSVALVWLVRAEMWPVALAFELIAAALVVVRRLREGSLPAGVLVGAALLIALTLCVPIAIKRYYTPSPDSEIGKAIGVQPKRPECEQKLAAARADEVDGTAFMSLRARIVRARVLATCSPAAGSNIDADVEFNSVADFARYLPRAVAIGFLAPLPTMWFASGSQVGSVGRALGGFEMLLTYLIELLALAGLWAWRARLSAWFFALSCFVGTTALGLVMPNIGTLYRMRYAFWILIVVLAAGSASRFIYARAHERSETETFVSGNNR